MKKLLITCAIALVGCNQVREDVITFDASGVVQEKTQLTQEHLSTLTGGQLEVTRAMYGPGGELVVLLLDRAFGDIYYHMGMAREAPPLLYTVQTKDGKTIKAVSKHTGFSQGDCVFVREVNEEWRMGYSSQCG